MPSSIFFGRSFFTLKCRVVFFSFLFLIKPWLKGSNRNDFWTFFLIPKQSRVRNRWRASFELTNHNTKTWIILRSVVLWLVNLNYASHRFRTLKQSTRVKPHRCTKEQLDGSIGWRNIPSVEIRKNTHRREHHHQPWGTFCVKFCRICLPWTWKK